MLVWNGGAGSDAIPQVGIIGDVGVEWSSDRRGDLAPLASSPAAGGGLLLGLDVGDRRIGLAVRMPPGALVTPAGWLTRRNTRADVAAIRQEAERRGAAAIVAGMPLDAQGRPGAQGRKTERLLQAVARAVSVPVFVVDESFTSQTAVAELAAAERGSGRVRSSRRSARAGWERGDVDAAAAVAILRRFLETENPAQVRSHSDRGSPQGMPGRGPAAE